MRKLCGPIIEKSGEYFDAISSRLNAKSPDVQSGKNEDSIRAEITASIAELRNQYCSDSSDPLSSILSNALSTLEENIYTLPSCGAKAHSNRAQKRLKTPRIPASPHKAGESHIPALEESGLPHPYTMKSWFIPPKTPDGTIAHDINALTPGNVETLKPGKDSTKYFHVRVKEGILVIPYSRVYSASAITNTSLFQIGDAIGPSKKKDLVKNNGAVFCIRAPVSNPDQYGADPWVLILIPAWALPKVPHPNNLVFKDVESLA